MQVGPCLTETTASSLLCDNQEERNTLLTHVRNVDRHAISCSLLFELFVARSYNVTILVFVFLDYRRPILPMCKSTGSLSSAPVWSNSLRHVSYRKATELAKRKETVETDEERLEYHVFNISSEIRRIKRINKLDMLAVLELLERGESIMKADSVSHSEMFHERILKQFWLNHI